MPAGMADADRRHLVIRSTAAAGEGLPALSGNADGSGGGLHFHRPGAEPDHCGAGFALRAAFPLAGCGSPPRVFAEQPDFLAPLGASIRVADTLAGMVIKSPYRG